MHSNSHFFKVLKLEFIWTQNFTGNMLWYAATQLSFSLVMSCALRFIMDHLAGLTSE